MVIIRSAQVLAGEHGAAGVPDRVPDADRLQAQAARLFAGDLPAPCRAWPGYELLPPAVMLAAPVSR